MFETNNGDQGFFFFKKVMENFVQKNIEMFLKENFVVNLDF